MPRLTRTESQAQTRAALLKAARTVLVEKGITAASVDVIAEAAGYSKGAVYSNFTSKEAIFLALMDEHMHAEVAALSTILAETSSLEDFLGRIAALYSQMHTDPGTCILSVEFQLLATRNPEARKQYLAQWSKHRRTLATLLSKAAARLEMQLRVPAPDVIDALSALAHGLVIQQAIGRPKGAISVQDAMIRFLRGELLPK